MAAVSTVGTCCCGTSIPCCTDPIPDVLHVTLVGNAGCSYLDQSFDVTYQANPGASDSSIPNATTHYWCGDFTIPSGRCGAGTYRLALSFTTDGTCGSVAGCTILVAGGGDCTAQVASWSSGSNANKWVCGIGLSLDSCSPFSMSGGTSNLALTAGFMCQNVLDPDYGCTGGYAIASITISE